MKQTIILHPTANNRWKFTKKLVPVSPKTVFFGFLASAFVMAASAMITAAKAISQGPVTTETVIYVPTTNFAVIPDKVVAPKPVVPVVETKTLSAPEPVARDNSLSVIDQVARLAPTGKRQAFIKRFAKVAVAEHHKYGIPASVKMAQAIFESQDGTSTLARKHNAYFGIKCFSKTCKKGHCSNHKDDTAKDMFRNYPNAWTSFRAHSTFLKEGAHYRKLFTYGDDYVKWAHGLKKAGYATDEEYAEKLIKLIEANKLYLLDRL